MPSPKPPDLMDLSAVEEDALPRPLSEAWLDARNAQNNPEEPDLAKVFRATERTLAAATCILLPEVLAQPSDQPSKQRVIKNLNHDGMATLSMGGRYQLLSSVTKAYLALPDPMVPRVKEWWARAARGDRLGHLTSIRNLAFHTFQHWSGAKKKDWCSQALSEQDGFQGSSIDELIQDPSLAKSWQGRPRWSLQGLGSRCGTAPAEAARP